MPSVLEAKNLTKRYGDVIAVDDVSLVVEQGALFGLLGPNGSGKTTMIKMLTGQTRPTEGSATVLGVEVTKDPVGVRGLVGIIPEQETPPSFLTANSISGSLRQSGKSLTLRQKQTGGLIFSILPIKRMFSAKTFHGVPVRN
jgi:ABC-type multidrug transport system ATPase subunit